MKVDEGDGGGEMLSNQPNFFFSHGERCEEAIEANFLKQALSNYPSGSGQTRKDEWMDSWMDGYIFAGCIEYKAVSALTRGLAHQVWYVFIGLHRNPCVVSSYVSSDGFHETVHSHTAGCIWATFLQG